MHFGKRELVALALIGSTLPMEAYAGDFYTLYPHRPITLVVGYSAGGGVDILARSLAKHMSENLKQQVIVENRPGAASNIAADSVARAEPDGYTLYISTHPGPPRQASQADAASDPGGRLTPIGLLATVPNVIVAGPQTPITSIHDLVTLAKTHPQMLSFGSPGVGSPPHLLGELFLRKTQTELLHVPYKGGAPAIPEVIAGRLDVLFISLPGALAHIHAGKVRALAVMSSRRVTAIAGVPTMADSGVPGLDMETRFGLMAPAGTPAEVIARLNQSVNAVLANPELQQAFLERGYVAPQGTNTPETFKAVVAAEVRKWDTASPASE